MWVKSQQLFFSLGTATFSSLEVLTLVGSIDGRDLPMMASFEDLRKALSRFYVVMDVSVVVVALRIVTCQV